MSTHNLSREIWPFPTNKTVWLKGKGHYTQRGDEPVCCSAWCFHHQTCSGQNPSFFLLWGGCCTQKAGTSPAVRYPYLMASDKAFRQFLFATRCSLVCSLHVSTLRCTCITVAKTLITWAVTRSQSIIVIIDIDFW